MFYALSCHAVLCSALPCRAVLCREVRAGILPGKTKLVMVESPTNPRMQICDIVAICKMAHDAGAIVCVDNSIMAPVGGGRGGGHDSPTLRCVEGGGREGACMKPRAAAGALFVGECRDHCVWMDSNVRVGRAQHGGPRRGGVRFQRPLDLHPTS